MWSSRAKGHFYTIAVVPRYWLLFLSRYGMLSELSVLVDQHNFNSLMLTQRDTKGHKGSVSRAESFSNILSWKQQSKQKQRLTWIMAQPAVWGVTRTFTDCFEGSSLNSMLARWSKSRLPYGESSYLHLRFTDRFLNAIKNNTPHYTQTEIDERRPCEPSLTS